MSVANGSDANGDGSIGRPFASLSRAQTAARLALGRTPPATPVTVLVRAGTYYLQEPLRLSEADSGQPGAQTIYAAYPGEEVVLSGGKRLDSDGLQWKEWHPSHTWAQHTKHTRTKGLLLALSSEFSLLCSAWMRVPG